MHQFYHAVRTSEGEESGEQMGKPHLIIYIFVVQCAKKFFEWLRKQFTMIKS